MQISVRFASTQRFALFLKKENSAVCPEKFDYLTE